MTGMSDVKCPTCSASVSMRINRNGFWQRNVFGHFGIYPWKCGACGVVFLYRRRGNRPSPGQPIVEPPTFNRSEGSRS
jgi:hypothetical protein